MLPQISEVRAKGKEDSMQAAASLLYQICEAVRDKIEARVTNLKSEESSHLRAISQACRVILAQRRTGLARLQA